jgi:hypothetical protein
MALLPGWIEPMTPTLTHQRFTGDARTFEQELDGIRLLAFVDGGDVRAARSSSGARSPTRAPIIPPAARDRTPRVAARDYPAGAPPHAQCDDRESRYWSQ